MCMIMNVDNSKKVRKLFQTPQIKKRKERQSQEPQLRSLREHEMPTAGRAGKTFDPNAIIASPFSPHYLNCSLIIL